MGLVISLCDKTGNMVMPWLEAGHDCVLVDTQHPPGKTSEGRLHKLGSKVEDVRTSLGTERLRDAVVFAFPPCTDVAVSGASHFQAKGLNRLIAALTTLEACVHIGEQAKVWMIENPVSVFSSYWKKPNFIVNPFEYADQSDNWREELYSKKTCLWTSPSFVLPPATCGFNKDPRKILNTGGKDRQETRSVTPLGFANAVYQANKHHLNVQR